MRVNWLAIIVSSIVLFLFGWVWYGMLFASMWLAEMQKINPQFTPGMSASWYPYTVSIVTGLLSAYGVARVIEWRNAFTFARGAFIGASMGILFFGTMTWMGYAYSHFGMALGWINIGFVAVGLALQGAILGAWKPKA
jgi:hypothetical protein